MIYIGNLGGIWKLKMENTALKHLQVMGLPKMVWNCPAPMLRNWKVAVAPQVLKHIWHAGKLPIFMANIHPLKERILCIWHLTRKYRSSVHSGFHSLQAIDEVPCKGHGVYPWAPVGNQYGLTSWQSLSYLVPNTSNRFKQVYIRYNKWLK